MLLRFHRDACSERRKNSSRMQGHGAESSDDLQDRGDSVESVSR